MPWGRVVSWLLGVGLLLLIFGLCTSSLLDAVPWPRTREYLRWSLLALLAGWVAMPLLGMRLATALAVVWLFAHALFAGLHASLAAGMLALTALGIGSRLTEGRQLHPLLSLVLGLAIIAAAIGWLLPVPVHRSGVYWAVALVTIALRRTAIRSAALELTAQWRRALDGAPWLSACAVMALGLASTATWLPTMMFDDLAYHLGLPSQLQQLGYYRMDAATQVWALAPWAGDALQAFAQLIAQQEARGSVNLLWLLAGAGLLASYCRNAGLSPAMSCVAVVLYASLPLNGALLSGMQTEGPAVVCLLALALLVQRSAQSDRGHTLLLAALLSGFALQLKVSLVVPLGLMFLWLLWEWRGRLPWGSLPKALLAAMLVGGASYGYAWLLADNPVLPLYNDIFQSPYYRIERFYDDHYGRGWSLDMLWRIVFHSDEVHEGWAGVGGFHLIALAGLLPLALWQSRVRGLTAVALFTALILYGLMNYLRYLHPALVLLIPGLLSALALLPHPRVAAGLVLALALLNFACQPNATWQLRLGAVQTVMSARGDVQQVLGQLAPERVVAGPLDPNARIWMAGRSAHAPFAGRALVSNWYDWELVAKVWPMVSGAQTTDVRRFLAEQGFTHVLIAGPPQIPDLQRHLQALGAVQLNTVGDCSYWRLPAFADAPARDLVAERNRALRQPWF